MSFKCKLSSAVLACEHMSIDYKRQGVLLPTREAVLTHNELKIESGPNVLYFEPDTEIEVSDGGMAEGVKDFWNIEHDIEFETAERTALRQDHICALAL